MNYRQKMIQERAQEIKEAGFRVFLSKDGEYGFFTDAEGSRVVSFGLDLGVTRFSGNYISEGNGSGWRMEGDTYSAMFKQNPPSWAVGNTPTKLKTLKQYLKDYQRSSLFKQVI